MKILVPTDFSSASMKAVEAAVWLARRSKAEVIIHHAYSFKLRWSKLAIQPSEAAMDDMSNEEQAQAVLDNFKKRYSDIPIKTQLSNYETIEELLEQARYNAVDLIITGTRGEQSPANRILGSDTRRMVRLAHCPVIVLPEGDITFPFQRILFVSDLTEDFSPYLGKLLVIAEGMQAEVHLGFVNTPMNFQCSEETEKNFRNLQEEVTAAFLPGHIYNHVRVDSGIQLMARRAKADAIALVTHSRGGFQRLFYSSLTEKIAISSDLPLISFHYRG